MTRESLLKELQKQLKPAVFIKYVSLALLIRVIILGYFLSQAPQTAFSDKIIGGVVVKMNDYDYFLGTIDNYLKNGTMTYYDQVKPFAGRMPGYGIPYLIIRMFCDQVPGLVILIGLQTVLASIATFFLGLIALMISGRINIGKTVFWLFAISAPTMIFDIFTLSESFSISAIIFFLFFLWKYDLDDKKPGLLFSGFFLAWAIFLRPFLGIFILVVPLFLLIRLLKKHAFANVITTITIFLLPFIVFETAWVIRNFMVMGRFIPLETSLSESYGEDGAYRTSAIGIRSMINAWGGETGEFYTGSEGWFFHHANDSQARAYRFPDHVFNAGFNKDSLLRLKYIFNQSVNHDLPDNIRDSLNMLANRVALRYAAEYRRHNLIRYYGINTVKMYGKLVFSNGTRLLILPPVNEMNSFQKAIKYFYFLYYFGLILAGIAGMLLFLLQKEKVSSYGLLLLFYPWIIATTLVFYASFVIIEYRYLISGFPVFLIFAVYGVFNLQVFKRKPD